MLARVSRCAFLPCTCQKQGAPMQPLCSHGSAQEGKASSMWRAKSGSEVVCDPGIAAQKIVEKRRGEDLYTNCVGFRV